MKREEIKKGLISYLESINWGIGEYDEIFGCLLDMLSFPENDCTCGNCKFVYLYCDRYGHDVAACDCCNNWEDYSYEEA